MDPEHPQYLVVIWITLQTASELLLCVYNPDFYSHWMEIHYYSFLELFAAGWGTKNLIMYLIYPTCLFLHVLGF